MPDRRETSSFAFRQLHAGPDLLTLTNAWDALSARVMADFSARAIANSSAAVAWSQGIPTTTGCPWRSLGGRYPTPDPRGSACQ